MSVLRNIEQKIEGLFEGMFGRAFRTHVQPVELGVEREEFTLTMNGDTRVLNERRLVMGRSKECDVQVADSNVSRRHAELRQEGSTWWVVDLDSTNGTEVNGKRVPRAKLSPGDTIMLGETALVFDRKGA